MNHSNIIDLKSHYEIVKISGNDPAKLLQGQLTCDMREVTIQNPSFGCYCNIKGRVELIFWVFKLADDYYLRLPKTIIEYAIAELGKYAIFSKTKLENSDLSFNHYGIIGNIQFNEQRDFYFDYAKLGIKNTAEVFTSETLEATGTLQNWQQHLITHKIPEIYPEIIGHFLPHNINLRNLNAISFTKGCYRGQEIVARMEHLGNIKYQLYTATIDKKSQINLGEDVYDQNKKIVGKVVNYCENIALVQLPIDLLPISTLTTSTCMLFSAH